MRIVVSIPPYAPAPGRLEAELTFPAAEKRRAAEHRRTAADLAGLFGVEYRTPWRLTPNWTVYQEMTYGTKFGTLDERRLIVTGAERAVARYLAALTRVLDELEAAATRAARAFGRWRRSLIATLSGHLDYEDPGTLRVRAREFRTQVLAHLGGYLLTPPAPDAARRDSARPLWEQADAVAAEVWHERPVEPWDVPEDEVASVLAGAVRAVDPVVLVDADAEPAAVDDQEPEPETARLPVAEPLSFDRMTCAFPGIATTRGVPRGHDRPVRSDRRRRSLRRRAGNPLQRPAQRPLDGRQPAAHGSGPGRPRRAGRVWGAGALLRDDRVTTTSPLPRKAAA